MIITLFQYWTKLAGYISDIMAQSRGLSQSKETLLKSYTKRLKDDVKSILDNFTEIIKTSKVWFALVNKI